MYIIIIIIYIYIYTTLYSIVLCCDNMIRLSVNHVPHMIQICFTDIEAIVSPILRQWLKSTENTSNLPNPNQSKEQNADRLFAWFLWFIID